MDRFVWAVAEVNGLLEERKALSKLWERNRSRQLSSMINEIEEKIAHLLRYCDRSQLENTEPERIANQVYKRKIRMSVSCQHIEIYADPRKWEDEVIDKIQSDSSIETETDPAPLLSCLPKRQMEAMALFANGLTFTSIATIMGRQRGTVVKHVRLAKKRLKKIYAE